MSEDKMHMGIMSEDKKEIMSDQRAVTPNLQQYLDDNDLSQYSDKFVQLGYMSTDKICCLPEDMDTNFVEALNINSNIHHFKVRTMLNEIRREYANNTLNKILNVSNTNNINDNKTEVIDLISPEPIEENNTNNEINSTNQHKKYFLQLLSKYGTKMEYNIDEKVTFFIPDFIPEKYIDRIGIIKSKISDMEYTIIDEKSQIIYNIPLEYMLKLNENNNINININNKSNIINTECGLCYRQMQKLKAKKIYNHQFICDGNECNQILKGNDIVYHCNNIKWHQNEYDLCCSCIKNNNKYKRISKASSTCYNPIPWNSWEKQFVFNCDKKYKKRYDITQDQKCIEISCKLNTFTALVREDNDKYAPWRTSSAVNYILTKKKENLQNDKKRKKYETRSSSSPAKKRRTS